MTETNILNNAEQKFADARKSCPGMPEEVYAITDYISTVVKNNVSPENLLLCITLIADDIKKGRNGFEENKELPEYLISHKEQLISKITLIPQVIDNIADKNFAQKFRKIYTEEFGAIPPKNTRPDLDSQYPEYIVAAVDWWTDAILSPSFDNGEEIDPFFMTMLSNTSHGSYSEEEIKIFRNNLAKSIAEELKTSYNCILSVDYHPCEILAEAAAKIGITGMSDFPWKTSMIISYSSVQVKQGHGAEFKTIWPYELENDIEHGNTNKHKRS